MTPADLIPDLLRLNAAASVAILTVLALRPLALRWLGADMAYSLWILPPMTLLSAGVVRAAVWGRDGPVSGAIWGELIVVWTLGALAALAVLAFGQARFLRRAAKGRAGPAVVGVLEPKIVLPADFDQHFNADEKRLIVAHERAHIDRGDLTTNALLVLTQCLCWFNPLIHMAAHFARLDQEMACDAAVMVRVPQSRKRYAEAMLKSQMGPVTALPLGCHWLPFSRHPLELRIAMLQRAKPSLGRRDLGAIALTALVSVGALAVPATLAVRSAIAKPAVAAPVQAPPAAHSKAAILMNMHPVDEGAAKPAP